MKALITGAGGGLGSHLVEAFAAAGHRVTGLVRSAGPEPRPAASVAGFAALDLAAPAPPPLGPFEQDCVVHTVSRVGDACRGPDEAAADLRATRAVLAAAARAGCPRFVHISSIAAHALPADGGLVSETTPLNTAPEPWNHYVRAKIACEQAVRDAQRDGVCETTVIRPSVFLGRRDRHATPRILRLLASPLAGVIGDGRNLVPCVDMAELAALIVAAAESRLAAGRIYDVSSRTEFTQSDLLALHAAAAGLPTPRRMPRWTASAAATALEGLGRVTRSRSLPLLSRFMVASACLNCRVDSSRAAHDLGWRGTADLARSIRESVSWTREHAS